MLNKIIQKSSALWQYFERRLLEIGRGVCLNQHSAIEQTKGYNFEVVLRNSTLERFVSIILAESQMNFYSQSRNDCFSSYHKSFPGIQL